MNKFILTTILSLFLFNSVAQAQGQEQETIKATKISDEMAEVLSLDLEEKAKVFQIQLDRFTKAVAIRKDHKEDKELMRSELKKNTNKLWGKLKGLLGEERMKAWGDYKRNY